MSYRIRIPYRDRDQPLDADALWELPRALQDEDARVAREVLAEARLSGAQTVGDVLDRIERASPAERRRIADRAREAVGLESVTAIEERRRVAASTRWPPPPPEVGPGRDENGSWIPTCAADGCEAIPAHPGGAPRPVPDRRWWCETHRDQAGPDDHLPPDFRIRLDRRGRPRMRPEVEEHYARVYGRLEEDFRLGQEAKAAEAERIAKLEDDYRETLKPPAASRPPIWRGRDAG